MSWDHTGHDRRRGNDTVYGERTGYQWICLDCEVEGFTTQDISEWALFTEADYLRHMKWIDPEVYAWSNGENDGP